MKITRNQLRRIIKEELESALTEQRTSVAEYEGSEDAMRDYLRAVYFGPPNTEEDDNYERWSGHLDRIEQDNRQSWKGSLLKVKEGDTISTLLDDLCGGGLTLEPGSEETYKKFAITVKNSHNKAFAKIIEFERRGAQVRGDSSAVPWWVNEAVEGFIHGPITDINLIIPGKYIIVSERDVPMGCLPDTDI